MFRPGKSQCSTEEVNVPPQGIKSMFRPRPRGIFMSILDPMSTYSYLATITLDLDGHSHESDSIGSERGDSKKEAFTSRCRWSSNPAQVILDKSHEMVFDLLQNIDYGSMAAKILFSESEGIKFNGTIKELPMEKVKGRPIWMVDTPNNSDPNWLLIRRCAELSSAMYTIPVFILNPKVGLIGRIIIFKSCKIIFFNLQIFNKTEINFERNFMLPNNSKSFGVTETRKFRQIGIGSFQSSSCSS